MQYDMCPHELIEKIRINHAKKLLESGKRIYSVAKKTGFSTIRSFRRAFEKQTGVLGTTELYAYDVDSDEIDDLVFAFEGCVAILTWNQNGYFDLFYLDWLERWSQTIEAVNIYNIYEMGKSDLIISYNDSEGIPHRKSEVFRNNFITNITQPKTTIPKEYILYQNYPNPFNNNTNILFYLTRSCTISLVVYDITGKEVMILIKDHLFLPGE
jgi:hypothetical protein